MPELQQQGWSFKAELKGVPQALAALDEYGKTIKNRAARKAYTKGAQILYKEARQRVPVRSKQYRKALFYRVWTTKDGSKTLAFIGPRMGFKTTYKGNPVDPVYYAHLVEGGRKAVSVKGKKVLSDGGKVYGRRVKAMAPRKPLELTFQSKEGEATKVIIEVLAAEGEKAAAKLAAKAARQR